MHALLAICWIVAPGVTAGTGSYESATLEFIAPAWRKPDANGRACSSCHSPDGFELAAYAFSDSDIQRRAKAHVSEAESKQIVEMVHGIRRRYGIAKPLDPMKDRPMQPGGEVLPGKNPAERDAEFAMELPAITPVFFGKLIDSVRAAKVARDQILRLDLSNLKIGIPLNRLSEDEFHGKGHATIADWIPDVPVRGDYSLGLQDRYIADPSEKNFVALDEKLAAAAMEQRTPAEALSAAKRRALLYFQHKLRWRSLGVKRPIEVRRPYPMWAIGDFARQNAESTLDAMELPEDIAAKKVKGPAWAEQLRQLRLPWMWLGWCMDPGLQKTSPITQTMRGDYFSFALWADGPYPMHLAFMMTRKIVSESFDPQSWSSAPPQHLDLDYSNLTFDRGIKGPLPLSPSARRLFDSFVANSFRMLLYLQLDELGRTHTVYLRQALIQQIERIKAIRYKDPDDIALADRVLGIIARCKDGGRWRHGQA